MSLPMNHRFARAGTKNCFEVLFLINYYVSPMPGKYFFYYKRTGPLLRLDRNLMGLVSHNKVYVRLPALRNQRI